MHAVLGDEITGGDFVRNTKQLIDLLRQLGDVAADPRTGAICRSAADRLFRGVVEAGSNADGAPAPTSSISTPSGTHEP